MTKTLGHPGATSRTLCWCLSEPEIGEALYSGGGRPRYRASWDLHWGWMAARATPWEGCARQPNLNILKKKIGQPGNLDKIVVELRKILSRVGYAHLQEALGLKVLPPRRTAEIRPVNRIEEIAGRLAVPAARAPASADLLGHVLFALKHEGTELAILMGALRHVDESAILDEIAQRPYGQYGRIAGYLWEIANNRLLENPGVPSAAQYFDVFDPDRYVTAPGIRDTRWRVRFNGLGTLRHCATVVRTPAVEHGIASQILQRAREYAEGLDEVVRDRALSWAYLNETEHSYAIEREIPSPERAKAFVALLHEAHLRQPLIEDYLVQLQQSTITNPYLRATSFRTTQNHLASEVRGPAGVKYVPPPPGIADELMHELMEFANQEPMPCDPIVMAAIVSFDFVFIHPFDDGNGRLSRFLFHHTLCRSGELTNGLILPVSIAMKNHEHEYLRALRSFSAPMRELWDVRWIADSDFHFQYLGDADHTAYRYWDATACVEFSFKMAELALDLELRQETEYLMRYDAIVREVNAHYDVAQSDLSVLVRSLIEQDGRLSNNRRSRYRDRIPTETLDAIEGIAQSVLRQEDGIEPPSP